MELYKNRILFNLTILRKYRIIQIGICGIFFIRNPNKGGCIDGKNKI